MVLSGLQEYGINDSDRRLPPVSLGALLGADVMHKSVIFIGVWSDSDGIVPIILITFRPSPPLAAHSGPNA